MGILPMLEHGLEGRGTSDGATISDRGILTTKDTKAQRRELPRRGKPCIAVGFNLRTTDAVCFAQAALTGPTGSVNPVRVGVGFASCSAG